MEQLIGTECIIVTEPVEMWLTSLLVNPLRIPHPKIGELAHQAQGVGIFAQCAKFPGRNYADLYQEKYTPWCQ